MRPYIGDDVHIVNNFLHQCIAAKVTEVTEIDFAVTMFAPHGDRGDTANRMRVRWEDTKRWHGKQDTMLGSIWECNPNNLFSF